MITKLRRMAFTIALLMICVSPANAQIVWTSPSVEFSKAAFADPNLAENQDRITPLVWITRGSLQGIYNVAQEPGFVRSVSPVDTEWAFQDLNGNPAAGISAADFGALVFADWTTALGGQGQLAGNILDRPGVVHLINEDIYIDIIFTDWGVGAGAGGSFTYLRAAPTANDDTANTLEGVPVTIDILANDSNLSDPTTVSLPGGGVSTAGCTVVINGTNPGDPAQIDVTYDAVCGFGAPFADAFDYTVDVAGQQSTAQVSVQVDANATPVAPDATGPDIDTTGVDPPSQASVIDVTTIAGADLGNTPASVTIVAQGTLGTAAVAGTVITYTPAGTSYVGTDTYTYQIEDAQSDTDTGVITVNYVDSQPVAGDGAAETDEDTPVDVDLDPLTTLGNGPEGAHVNGIVNATGGTAVFLDPFVNDVVTYTPDLGFVGQGSFTYFVEDADGDRDEGTVLITVNATGDLVVKLPGGGSSALGPLTLILLLGLPLLRRRRRVI
ncbi:MAG: hypothetical protein JSV45_05925 [Chromatiales bacterium]|nr:MAG: hypothetical protein JSV45_05925 [Chromatiales bacterium]